MPFDSQAPSQARKAARKQPEPTGCRECGCEDAEIGEDGLCDDCAWDTSTAGMRKDYGTWSV